MGSDIIDKTKQKLNDTIKHAKQSVTETTEGIKRTFGAGGYTRIPTAPEQWVERVKCVGSNNTIDKVVDEAVNSGSSSDKPAQSRAEICNKEIKEKYDAIDSDNQKLYDQRTKDRSTTSGVSDPHALLLTSIQEAREMTSAQPAAKQL